MSGSLANSPAEIIKTLFVALGHGTLVESLSTWPIVVAITPDSPDNFITLTNTSGIMEGRFQVSGEMQEQYGIQIKVRASFHPTGWTKINELKQACDVGVYMNNVTIGASQYIVYAITRKGGVLDLGYDIGSTKRHLFTLNATVSLKQVA